jgi:hypothetical protein
MGAKRDKKPNLDKKAKTARPKKGGMIEKKREGGKR